MKKIARVILVIIFVFGILLASTPMTALAKINPTDPVTPSFKPLIAGGSWTSGQYADVSTLAATAPQWMQLLADGVKVTEAGKICHPLRGGQFGWVGVIMHYKNGKWVKLTTTNDWVPNKEGEFMSCAQAPAAGTYALFGYWIRPAGYVNPQGETPGNICAYSTTEWDSEWSNSNEDATQDIDISGLQSELNGQILTLTVVSDLANMLANDTYTVTIAGGAAKYEEILSYTNGVIEFTVSVSGCSKSFTLSWED